MEFWRFLPGKLEGDSLLIRVSSIGTERHLIHDFSDDLF